MKQFLPPLLLIALLLVGCDQQTTTESVEFTPKVSPSAAPAYNRGGTTKVAAPVTNQTPAFTITSKGTFKAGYDNETREILVVKDNETGVEYIVITDASLIRRAKAKAEAVADTLSDVADAMGDFSTE